MAEDAAAALQQLQGLWAAGRFDDIEAAARQLADADPANAEAHYMRGNALYRLGRVQEALHCYSAAIALLPGEAVLWRNRASAHNNLRDLDSAIADYDRAIALAPGFMEARFDRGLSGLLKGDYASSWPHYEAGREARSQRRLPQPRWRAGMPLAGRSVLVFAEEGLGDTLHMARYLPMVAARGAHVVAEVQPALGAIVARMPGVAVVRAQGEPLPATDLQVPLLSLPGAFGTTLQDIPAATGYATADAARVDAWRAKLGPATRPRVGLAWSGNPRHPRDRARSLPLALLLRALPAGIDYFVLQKDVRRGRQ
jgi:tetratricopeptide (TPR) repeat protein